MSWATVVAARLRGLFGHKRLERELEEEVQFHLEMHDVPNGLNIPRWSWDGLQL